MSARRLAVDALVRIENGAYANLVVPALLDRSTLDARDRGLVTELVYGTTRMRRACDWLVDRFLLRPVDPGVRAALRVGAYQLAFLSMPPHAAVTTAVDAAPARSRGLVNAVLRRVADAGPPGDRGWPDDATRLSYPQWIVERFRRDLGAAGDTALEAMNGPATVTVRDDGYVQDVASQWVAGALGAAPGERIVDVCAAPGGKATALARRGPRVVVALDVRPSRAALVAANAKALDLGNVSVAVADGRRPPVRDRMADRALVDAPCSGLGVLRRRPDARWRVEPVDVVRLASLQRELLDAALALVRPGGVLAYSVCTLTVEETVDVDAWLAAAHPELRPLPPPGAPWEPLGRGARLLPQSAGTDGMFLLIGRVEPAQ